MLPLALILKGRGATVKGSDRSLDQGRSPDKFKYLQQLGIELFPQDGSGLQSSSQILVASAAIEESVPDIVAAKLLGCDRKSRAELLSSLFNESPVRIGVAGTSGKSTTTGMIAWMLSDLGEDPTVMNGAVMKNFVNDNSLFASAIVGQGTSFTTEVDESDGSIKLYEPSIAVLNNISHDHKSMEELRELFGGFINRADMSVLNFDDSETVAIRNQARHVISYGIDRNDVDITATSIRERSSSIAAQITHISSGTTAQLELQTPGLHNVSNALAAISVGHLLGLSLTTMTVCLSKFAGIKRRFEIVGTKDGVTVIDDFAHNPDKIKATLRTLRAFPGRLIVIFQPHGYGPLRTLRDELVQTFKSGLQKDDILILPEPVYFGGTVDKSVTSCDLVNDLEQLDVNVYHLQNRNQGLPLISEIAEPGDRVIIMGARDDTLSVYANMVLDAIPSRNIA